MTAALALAAPGKHGVDSNHGASAASATRHAVARVRLPTASPRQSIHGTLYTLLESLHAVCHRPRKLPPREQQPGGAALAAADCSD